MKCPKCGYNSFELYDSCRKCGSDLVGFKQNHGIRAIVHPPQFLGEDALPAGAFTSEEPLVADDMTEAAAPAENIAWDLPSEEKSGEDGFAGFDLDFSMDEEKDGEFSFDEEPAGNEAAKEEELGFGEFSFDEEESASAESELDDLLAADDELTAEATPAMPGEFDFDAEEEFSLESNAIGFDLKEDDSLPAFDMDALDMDGSFAEEPAPTGEQPKKDEPGIDLSELTDDWPSFFEEEKTEESKK